MAQSGDTMWNVPSIGRVVQVGAAALVLLVMSLCALISCLPRSERYDESVHVPVTEAEQFCDSSIRLPVNATNVHVGKRAYARSKIVFMRFNDSRSALQSWLRAVA